MGEEHPGRQTFSCLVGGQGTEEAGICSFRVSFPSSQSQETQTEFGFLQPSETGAQFELAREQNDFTGLGY